MTNKLMRLTELVDEGTGLSLVQTCKAEEALTCDQQLALFSHAIAFHQQRAADLWLKAGKKRTSAERKATAQGQLAAFIFASISGDAGEHLDTAVEAMETLGRHAEIDMVRSLVSSPERS